MSALDTQFGKLLLGRVREERESKISAMIDGSRDERSYSRICGIIWLLDQIPEWIDDIEKQINEGR